MKENTRVLIALGLAVAGGAVVGASRNLSWLAATQAIIPIGSIWVNAIRMTVIPLVVSLLITGVASASDVKAVGKLGGRSLLTFVALSAAVALCAVPVLPLVFKLLPPLRDLRLSPLLGTAADAFSIGHDKQTLSAWLVSLIPSNVVTAASEGAMIQVILFTLIFALAITRSSDLTRRTLLSFFRAFSEAMLRMVHWVVLLAPVGVFALVLPLAARLGPGLAGVIGFYIFAYAGGCIAAILVLYVLVAVFGGVSLRKFAKAALSPQLIALGSSSSIATLPSLVKSADEDLQLPGKTTGFVLPLAVSMFKVAAPVSWTTGALFVAAVYSIPLGARALFTIAFAAVFLAFGVPGVPRGAFIMLAPLFSAIGVPVEGIGLLIAVDAIPDTFATALNVTGDLAAATIVSRFDTSNPAMEVVNEPVIGIVSS